MRRRSSKASNSFSTTGTQCKTTCWRPSGNGVQLTGTMQIFIKTLTGRKQAFNFEPENQVLMVKQALQEKEGIQVDQIRLIHSGKQLADDKTLEFYNIVAGATIHMVLQLRGGSTESL